jgi:fructose-1,6-bisphosphatase/inositol monophosphatase family enzyme
MTAPDVAQLAEILREAARAEILPRWRRLSPDMVRTKSHAADLVTEADEAAERLIRARVAALLPGAAFVGEESVAADPELIGKVATADLAIVVDPVDGTGNFAAGLPLFAVMAAVVEKGETVAGLIYDPFADDAVVAEKGSGAFILGPDGSKPRISVAEPKPLGEMVGAASISMLPMEERARVGANLAGTRIASAYRCAGHEYRAFASGHLDFLFFHKLMPWDHLAGALIAAEAGAHVARLDGSEYRPSMTSGGLLLAPDAASWNALRSQIFTL